MGVFDDFVPATIDTSDVSLDKLVLPSAPVAHETVNDIGKPQEDNLSNWAKQPSSFETKLAPETFDWEKSNADRYVQNSHYKQEGFDPYAGVKNVEGKPYDVNELNYGQLQTFGDVMKNAVGGAWNLGIGSFEQSVKSWGSTANALFGWVGDNNKTFKERLIGTPDELLAQNKVQEDIMNKYAIYHTPSGDNSWFNKEFVGDIVQQMGFGLGMGAEILGETFATMGIGSAFEAFRGAGLAAKGIEGAADIAKGETVAENVSKLTPLSERINNFRTGTDISGDKNLMSTIWKNSKNLIPGVGLYDAAQDVSKAYSAGATGYELYKAGVPGVIKTFSMANAAKAEATMEAFNTYGQMYGDLIAKYQNEHDGQSPAGQELERIRQASYGASTDNFIVNTGLLMTMNQLEFGNLFTKFGSAKRLLREAEEGIAEGANKDIFTVKGKLTSGEQGKVAYQRGTGAFGLFSDVNHIRKDFGLGTALWQGAKRWGGSQAAKFEISEGIQEVLQNTSDQTFRDYYTNLYNGNKDIDGNNIFTDVAGADWGKGLQSQNLLNENQRGIKENSGGWKTFIMGAATGLFMSPLSNITMYANKRTQQTINPAYRTRQQEHDALLKEQTDLLNAFYKDPNKVLDEHIAAIKVQGKAADGQKDGLLDNDTYTYKNNKEDAFCKTVAAAIKTGNYESFIAHINELAPKMGDDASFAQAFPKAASLENKPGNMQQYLGNLTKDITDYHNRWQSLKDEYGDLVMPELHKASTIGYSRALLQKRALDEAIETLATTDWQAKKTVERAQGIKAEMGAIPAIGSSVARSFDVMGDKQETANELYLLSESLKVYEGLGNDREIKQLEKNQREQYNHLKAWQEHYSKREAPEVMSYEEFIANREGLRDAQKGYILAHNKEAGVGLQATIDDKVLDKSFKSLGDYMALNRDNRQYIQAMNVIANPRGFKLLHEKIVDGMQDAIIKKHFQQVNEIREKVNQATGTKESVTPTPEATTTTPEEVTPAPAGSPVPADNESLRREFLAHYTGEGRAPIEEEGEHEDTPTSLSEPALQHLRANKEFADTIDSIQELYKDDIPGMISKLKQYITEHFDDTTEPISHPEIAGNPHIERVKDFDYRIVHDEIHGKKTVRIAGTDVYKTVIAANKALEEYMDKQHPAFTVDDQEYRVGQYLYDNESKRYLITAYKNGKVYMGGQLITNEKVGTYHTEKPQNTPEEEVTTEPKSKILKIRDQVRIYPIEDRSLPKEQQRADAHRKLDKVLRDTPKDILLAGLSIAISPGPGRGQSFQLGDNPHIQQNREHWTMAVQYAGNTIGFINTPNLYTFTFDGKTVPVPELTVEQFKKVFDTGGKDANALLQTFQNDYRNAQALGSAISIYMGKNPSAILSGDSLHNFMDIVPLFHSYDYLNGPQEVDRPTIQQVLATGKQLVAVVDTGNGKDIYGDSTGISPASEEAKLGVYRAAVRLQNGDVQWVQLESAPYSKAELDNVVTQVEGIAQAIKKAGKDIQQAKNATEQLSKIFIAQDPAKGVYFNLRMNPNGDLQVGYLLRDNTSGYLTINAGKGKEDIAVSFNGNSEEFLSRIQDEINKKFARDKSKFPQDIVIRLQDIQKRFGKVPTEQDIMGMKTTVSTNITKGYYLDYKVKQSTIPQEFVPEPVETVTQPVTTEPTTPVKKGLSSIVNDDAELAAMTDGDPLAMIEELEKQQESRSKRAKKVVPTTTFSKDSVEHIDRFKEFVGKNLPGIISVEDMGVLEHNLLDNNITVGQFITQLSLLQQVKGVIQVYKNSPYKYHEAFHSVFRLLLTDQKIQSLLDIARKEHPVTEQGLDALRALHPSYAAMDRKTLEDRYLEEYMADKFDKWMTNNKVQTAHPIKSFFAKILDWIKGLFSRLSGSQLEGMFYDIKKGAYRQAKLQNNRFTDIDSFTISEPTMKVIEIGDQDIYTKDGRTITIPRTLPQQEGNQLSSAIAALFIQEIEGQPAYNKNAILDKILNQYKDMLNPKQQRYIDKALSIKDHTERARWIRSLSDKYHIFTHEDNRQSIKEAVNEHLKIMGLKQELDEEHLEQQDIKENEGQKGFDKAADSVGGYESIPQALRVYIGSTTRNYTDEFGNSQFLDGKPLIQAVNAGYVYNGLLQTMAGSTSDDDIVARMLLYRDGDGDSSVFLNRLMEESGFWYNETTNEWNITKNEVLFQSALNTFQQFSTNPLFGEIDPAKGTSRVFNANRENSARLQFVQWSQAHNAIYTPGYNQASAKVAYIRSKFSQFNTIDGQIDNADHRGKKISDNKLHTLAQATSNDIKQNMGISLHPRYIEYSIAQGKDQEIRTQRQQQLVNEYRGVYTMDTKDIAGIWHSLKSGQNIFSTTEGEDKKEGASTRLLNMAKGNAIFDETVWSMSYIGPDGERRFGYQKGTYNRVTVQKLNNGDYLQELQDSDDHKGSHLLYSDQFLEMANQNKLKVEDISGLKQVVHSVSKEANEEREYTISTFSNLEENKVKGTAFGQMNQREQQGFLLTSYGADGGRVQTGPGKEDYFETVPINIRVIAESSTSNMARLPVIHAVDTGKSGQAFSLSQEAVDILTDKVFDEIDRIKRVKEEIDTLPIPQQIYDYHNGAKRGLKLYDTANMLGKLAAGIENGVQGLDTDGNPLEKEYEPSRAAIQQQLRTYWRIQVNDYIDYLAELGLIDKKGDKVTNKLLPDFLFNGFTSEVRNEKLNLEKGNFRHNIAQVFMNDYLNRIGLVHLLYGDEAKAFKGPIDRIRRAKGANGAGDSMAFSVTAPNLGIEHPLKTFHHVLIPEPQYKKYSGEQGDKADAQMYMTTKSLRYMLFGFGKLSKVQADILDKIVEGNPVAEKDFIKAGGLNKKIEAFNSYKVVYFDGNTHLKCSAVVLTKEGTSYKDNSGIWKPLPTAEDLHHIRESMEAFEQHMDEIGIPTITYASPSTASKGLKYTVAPSVRNIHADYFHELSAADMRLQQETPSGKLSMTDPTGLKFNVLTEQDHNANAPYLDKKIGEVIKDYLRDSSLRITNNNYSVINSIFSKRDGTPIQAGDHIDPDLIDTNLGALYDRMKEVQQATGTDSQTLAFLETRDGQPLYDLNFPATLQKYAQMVLNYLSKGVLNEKIPGITASLVSDYGHQVIRQVHELDDKGQPKRWTVITTNQFKKSPSTYSNLIRYTDEDNRLYAGLPDPTKETVYILDNLKDSYPEYDSHGNLIGYFTETKRPAHYSEEAGGNILDSLSEGVGTRIPWDDKHQAVVQKVVDIMPAYYGSIMITADRVLEKSGSDMDGDKAFSAIMDTYPTGDGQRRAYGDADNPKDQFEEYIMWQATNNVLIKDSVRTLENTFEGSLSSLLDSDRQIVIAALKENKLPSTLQEFMARGGEDLNNGVLNNRILQQKIALLSNDHISGGEENAIINQATDTSPIKNLVDPDDPNSIIALLKGLGMKDTDPIIKQLQGNSSIDINTLRGMGEVFDSAMEGKKDIGAAIIAVMTGGLLQQYNKRGEGIMFDGKLHDDFGSTQTDDGMRKFSATSAIANTMTDNLKDGGTASKLGLTIDAVGIATTMVLQGIPLRSAMLYILQPAVRDYFRQLKELSGNLKTPEERNKSKNTLLDRMIDEYKDTETKGLTEADLLQNIADNGKDKILELSALRDIATIRKEVDTLSSINRVMQLAKGYPASWEDMDKTNEALGKLGIEWNSKKGRYTAISDEAFDNSGIPIDVRDILTTDHDIYSTYIQKFGQDRQLAKKLFLERTDLFGRMTDMVKANLDVQNRYAEEFDKQMKHDLISYLSIRAYMQWLKGDENRVVMLDTLSTLDHAMIYDTARQQKEPTFKDIYDTINDLRDIPKGQPKNYLISKFLRLYAAGEAENKDGINKAESNTWAKLSEHQQQQLQDSFTDLYSDPKTHSDAVALFNYLLVKDGGQFKAGSFIRYIPVYAFKDLLDRTKEVNELLSTGDYGEEKGMKVFGVSYPQVLNDFMTSYSTHTANKFFVKDISTTIPAPVTRMTAEEAATKKIDLQKLKDHITNKESKPIEVDKTTGHVVINLFKGIRDIQAYRDSKGITLIKEKGKYNPTEKAMLAKSIDYLESVGFNVQSGEDGIKVQMSYSIKIGGQLYVLRNIDKVNGEASATGLINKGEDIPQGIRGIYVKESWRGTKAQWKGAGVFGQIPEATPTPGKRKTENPPYAPEAPKQAPVQDKVDITSVPQNVPRETTLQDQLHEKGYHMQVDKNNRTIFYDSEGIVRGTSYSPTAVQDFLDHLSGKKEQNIVPSQQKKSLSDIEQGEVTDQMIDEGMLNCDLL